MTYCLEDGRKGTKLHATTIQVTLLNPATEEIITEMLSYRSTSPVDTQTLFEWVVRMNDDLRPDFEVVDAQELQQIPVRLLI